MMKPAPEDRERLELAADLLEQYLTSYVETGLVEVGDRVVEEILDEISRNISEDVEYQDFEVRPVFDHRDSLLDRAASAASEGQLEIAVVLYTTWIEHSV